MKVYGMEIEMMDAVGRKLGFKINYKYFEISYLKPDGTWGGKLGGLHAGQIHATLGTMIMLPHLHAEAEFSNYIYMDKFGLTSRVPIAME